MAFIEAENLIKTYGQPPAEVLAVNEVSFSLDHGEFMAVMGESGSGKSTLLSLLGALTSPISGRLLIDGLDVFDLNPNQRADFRREYLGFVFQNFHLAPYLTLIQNVMLPLAGLAKSKAWKRDMAASALAQVGLAGKENRLPSQASGGEQERTALARAIVNRPPLLLADEPTGSLDSLTADRVMELLSELNDQGMTIVMVTHSDKAAAAARRRLHLADGRLVDGPEAVHCVAEAGPILAAVAH